MSAELLAKVKVIYCGHAQQRGQPGRGCGACPSLSVFEKEGSFVNLSFRLQKFAAAVPGPRGILPDVAVLEKIAAPLADEKPAGR